MTVFEAEKWFENKGTKPLCLYSKGEKREMCETFQGETPNEINGLWDAS